MAQKRLPMRKARKILEFENIRRETRTRVIVLTDVGDNFFCVGGTHDEGEDTTLFFRCAPDAGVVRGYRTLANSCDRGCDRICFGRR